MTRFLTILCMVFYLQTFAQVKLVNISLKDSSRKEIYLKVDNELVVSGVDTSKNIFELKCKNEKTSIKKFRNAAFIVYRNDTIGTNEIDTLILFNNDKVVASFPFMYKEIASYYHVQVGNKKDSVYSLKNLLQAPFLKTYFPECNFKIKEEKVYVQRYIAEIDTKQSLLKKHFEVTGNRMTSELKNAIKKLGNGDKLIINGIILVGNILCPTSIDDKIIITIKN